jgi:DNA-binding LacI/PurR family transcriptional regulator
MTTTGPSVGIKDVASAAGVSITTVSHALNDKGRIPEETRRRIREVARRLGYQPNAIARSLAGGRAGVIALAFSLVGAEPIALTDVDYFGQAIREATTRALERDLALVIGPPTARGELWSRIPLDGVVVFDPVADDAILGALRGRGVPLVIVGRDPSGGEDDYRVDNDHVGGTRAVLEHLVERGARRVALLAGDLADSFTEDCLSAYRSWCHERGMTPLHELVPSPFDPVAREVLATWFGRADAPDAVYATFDALGAQTLRTAHELGLRVPDDLLVAVCADSESFIGLPVEPTTLNLHPARTAAEAIDLLVELIEGRAPNQRVRLIPTTLVPRASTERCGGPRGRAR